MRKRVKKEREREREREREKEVNYERFMYKMFFLQFGNFDHLRINDGDMNLIQYLSLDVAFFWCCLLVAVIYGLR